MLKILLLRIFKILKSLINLFINLIIKFIKTFSFIFLIKKYYSYFKFIAIYLKNFKYYYVYIWFIRSIAIFNVILGGFTILILTDFQIYEYITLLETNLNKYEIFIKFRNSIKTFFKNLIDLFSIEKISEDQIPTKEIKVENKIPYYNGIDFTFYSICFIVFTTIFSIAIYKSNIFDFSEIATSTITFFSSLFGSLFGKGGDDPNTLVAKATTQFQIPNIIVTEPSSPSSPINTSFPEYNNAGTQSPKLNDSPISLIPSHSKEILQGMDDRMIKILENQYKNVGTQASKLNNDSITILSPNSFIYTKEAGDKGDKLLDSIREILEKII